MPGLFLTDISKAWDQDAYAERARRLIPLRRGGEPEEIVGAALYLASAASSYTTGTILRVDGGLAPARAEHRSAQTGGPWTTDATAARGRVRVEPATKRVRIMLGGRVVADTTDAVYVWENPSYPQYYIPLADVAPGALKETGTTTHSPSRGTAAHFSVHGGDRVAEDAAWR